MDSCSYPGSSPIRMSTGFGEDDEDNKYANAINEGSSECVLQPSSVALDTIRDASDDEDGSGGCPEEEAPPPPETARFLPLTYEGVAKANGMQYTVCDVPPPMTSAFLGVQHYLTMLGGCVVVPLLVTPAMGATSVETAKVISTMFFVSGVNTLLQTTLGERLPIVQGSSFTFLPATFAIIENPALASIADDRERFVESMRVLQGSFIAVGLIQIAIAYSGVFSYLLRYIGPVTIGPVITVIGLSLYNIGFTNVATCFPIGLTQIALLVLFSQFMKSIEILGVRVFALFSIVLSVTVTWSIAACLTAAGAWEEGSPCRTDHAKDLRSQTPWLYLPYPGQWGSPRFESYAIAAMFGGAIPGMIESIGDYYSCASMSGAPPPTPGIISRGLGSEGIGLSVAGLFGTSGGTTSYSENIGAIALTRVGSRTVVQCGAVAMILVSCFAKISSLLASMPTALVGGVYCAIFGLIAAVGLSNLRHIDLNSQRNLFVVGFAIFNALSVAGPAGYITSLQGNPFGSTSGASVALAFFSSPMIVALLVAFILDNTIPGTRRERGLDAWDMAWDGSVNNDPEYVKVYSLPLCLAKIFRNCAYLESCALGHFPDPPVDGYQGGRGDIGELCFPCICDRNIKDSDSDEGVAREESPPVGENVEMTAVVVVEDEKAVVRSLTGDEETGPSQRPSLPWTMDEELAEEGFRITKVDAERQNNGSMNS